LLNYIFFYNNDSILSFLIMFLCFWVFVNILILLYNKIFNAMTIAHGGLIFFIFSVAYNNNFQLSSMEILKPGDTIRFAYYNWIFRNIYYGQSINYDSLFLNFLVENNQKYISIIFPERRLYFLQNNFNSKPAINSNFLSDIYVILGDGNINEGWYIKFIYNPLMIGVWLGIILMILGGIFSIHKLNKKHINNLTWI